MNPARTNIFKSGQVAIHQGEPVPRMSRPYTHAVTAAQPGGSWRKLMPSLGSFTSAVQRTTRRRPLVIRAYRVDDPDHSESAPISSDLSKKTNVAPGTLVFAIDTTDASQKALKWIFDSFLSKGDDIRLVHVVCNPRGDSTGVGTSASGRVCFSPPAAGTVDVDDFQQHEQRVHHATQRFVNLECIPLLRQQQVPHEVVYHTLEGARSAAVIGEAICHEGVHPTTKALIIASHGPGMMAEFGSVARYCYQHSPCPLVILPAHALEGGWGGGGPLVVAASEQRELETLLKWVAGSIVREGEPVEVFQTSGPKAPDLHLPHSFPVDLHLHRLDTDSIMPAVHASAHDLEDILGPYDAADADNAAAVALVDEVDKLGARLLVVPSYSAQGVTAEMAHASVASYMSRHSRRPLVLLRP